MEPGVALCTEKVLERKLFCILLRALLIMVATKVTSPMHCVSFHFTLSIVIFTVRSDCYFRYFYLFPQMLGIFFQKGYFPGILSVSPTMTSHKLDLCCHWIPLVWMQQKLHGCDRSHRQGGSLAFNWGMMIDVSFRWWWNNECWRMNDRWLTDRDPLLKVFIWSIFS